MRISHRFKFIFFANPKTGSSSVRQFLNPYTDVYPVKNYKERTAENSFYPHITPKETRALFEELNWDFNSYNKFVFVRNPWARLVSLYEHIMRNPENEMPFDVWLETIQPSGKGAGGEDWQRWRKYGAYSIEHYIKDDMGNILVDRIIRLEDIQQKLRPFLTNMGLPGVMELQLKHQNQRVNKAHYSTYYNAKTKAYVAERYRYDIVNFGYTFEQTLTRKFFSLFKPPFA